MSIRLQIITGFLLIVAAGFYYLTTWVLDDIRPHYLKAMEESLVDQATVLAALVSQDIKDGAVDPQRLATALRAAAQRRFEARIYDVTKTRTAIRVYVTDSAGIVLYDSDNGRDEGVDYSRWNDVSRTLAGRYGARSTRTETDNPLTSSQYVAAPILRDSAIAGVLTVVKPTGSVDQFIVQARGKITAAGVMAAAGVVVLGVLLSMWVTVPLRRLTAYARAVRDGTPATLPRLGGESAVMGEAMEQMRVALEGKAYVEQYVQTLTHEIKGPVAAIAASSELLQEDLPAEKRAQFAQNVRAETLRIQAIVDRMLELAAVENRRELREVAVVDIGLVCRTAAESIAPAFERKGVHLDTSAVQSVQVQAEQFLLRQALTNLLQNALDFTPPQGKVSVTVGRQGTHALVTVDDTGAGVPDYALPRVFERFYSLARPDTGRKSSGLGLSFVLQVARLHGGAATIANRPEGGARATFTVNVA